MTKQKQESKLKSYQDAAKAAIIGGLVSLAFGVPVEYVSRVALACGAYTLFLSLKNSVIKTNRMIPYNSANENRNIKFDYVASGYIYRDTPGDWLKSLFSKKPDKPQVRRPATLDEFTFRVFCKGSFVELKETHVKLFLNDAWRNRSNGKGLSARRWVRNRSQRPGWYLDLSPIWYYGLRELIAQAQYWLKIQLIVSSGNNWYHMSMPPREFYNLLKWYEIERR